VGTGAGVPSLGGFGRAEVFGALTLLAALFRAPATSIDDEHHRYQLEEC
jgi:hypothetical protein